MSKPFEIKDLVKIYPGFQLGPLNLDLEPGQVLGYIGPNGSGKTTTMHCLSGLVRPNSGEIHIFGKQNELNAPEWKQDIGYVGDVHAFYESWTGAKNLSFLSQFYSSWSDARAAELARRFDLPLDRKAKHLSTGNRIKLSLVSVLARSPRLLLLDEPTAGLDPVVRSDVLDALFEVLESGESAIFYSTHILSDISRLADELAFLSEGRLMLRSTIEDLVDRWRRISFHCSDSDITEVYPIVKHRTDGNDHQLISADFEETVSALREKGIDRIEINRMTVDEIAVQILKGVKDVAVSNTSGRRS